MFKGIDHAVGTNMPDGVGMPDLQVVNILRIDLTDPDIHFMTTPRYSGYVANVEETAAITVNNYATNYHVQAAINANDFSPNNYDITPGSPVMVTGILMNQGQIVSTQLTPGPAGYSTCDQYDCAMFITTNNQFTYVFTNWPAHSTAGFYNAVCGTYPILIKGTNTAYIYTNATYSSISTHQVQPRTVFGTTQDGHYLFLVAIDGRQPGYSDGALDWESGVWMLLLGAYNAINMDGGGSTTMVVVNSLGLPVELNSSSVLADPGYGYNRPVGAHLGVFAKPLPGFINSVAANVDNTAATITWETTAPATSRVSYGLSTNSLTNFTALSSALVTNHSALILNLLPNTSYYYNVASVSNGVPYVSSNFVFATSNYVTTNAVFSINNTWTFNASGDLDGIPWQAPSYQEDASWSSGSAIFWVDPNGVNTDIPYTVTQMSGDPNNYGYPFSVYYFRTHFTYTNLLANVSLVISAYVGDGAVFYLNGGEIYRLRMPAYPAPISSAILASGFPNAKLPQTNPDYGSATVPDLFEINGSAMTNLVAGDNVLAVEVHEYSSYSTAITFGMSMNATPQYDIPPLISDTATNNNMSVLSWTRGGFTLYQSPAVNGPWKPAQGPCGAVVSSPYIVTNGAGSLFYYLRRY